MAQRNLSQSESVASGVSRRQFLKNSGLFAGAALFVGAGLSGCTAGGEEKQAETSGADASGTSKGDSLSYSVYDADVLVIGTGFAGFNAALEANSRGLKVIMVDKGPYEFSGATGMNWDQEVFWPNDPPTDPLLADPFLMDNYNHGFANEKLAKNVWEYLGQSQSAWNSALWWVNMGGTTWNRLPDGSFENLALAGSPINMAQRGFSRHLQDTLKTQPITIIDHTMITDIFISGGVCVGAIGFQVQTGEYRVFRAKATVSAAGPCCQMYGWLDVHPIGMNTPDNTGDLQAAAYRHGASLIGNEFFAVDLISVDPSSLGASFNAGIGADGDHMLFICDKDGDFFMRETAQYDVSRAIREVVLAGKGGEHGGVFLDLTNPEALDPTKLRPCYMRNVFMWKEKFGIDVTQPGYKIPVSLECFEHAQGFVIDENSSSTIPGLYGTRGSGRNGFGINPLSFFGAYAGYKASEYAASVSSSTMDWAAAEAEIARIDEIRTREINGGIRPFEIRHKIQHSFYDNWEPATDATKLQTAIDELERIKSEDLPKQYVSNKSTTFNLDWKQAIENYNLIDSTEATLRAALIREESRGTFYRTDFPEIDEENWHLNIIATLKGGKMELEKLPQVKL